MTELSMGRRDVIKVAGAGLASSRGSCCDGKFSNDDVHEPFHFRVSTNGMRYRPAFSDRLSRLLISSSLCFWWTSWRCGPCHETADHPQTKKWSGARPCAPDFLGSDVAVLAAHGAKVLIHILFSNLAVMDTRRSEQVESAHA